MDQLSSNADCKRFMYIYITQEICIWNFIDIDTSLQLIMHVFPMDIFLQLSAHDYNILPGKLGG